MMSKRFPILTVYGFKYQSKNGVSEMIDPMSRIMEGEDN